MSTMSALEIQALEGAPAVWVDRKNRYLAAAGRARAMANKGGKPRGRS